MLRNWRHHKARDCGLEHERGFLVGPQALQKEEALLSRSSCRQRQRNKEEILWRIQFDATCVIGVVVAAAAVAAAAAAVAVHNWNVLIRFHMTDFLNKLLASKGNGGGSDTWCQGSMILSILFLSQHGSILAAYISAPTLGSMLRYCRDQRNARLFRHRHNKHLHINNHVVQK